MRAGHLVSRMTAAAVVLMVAGSAWASAEAKAVLERAAKAVSEIKALTYTAEFKGVGGMLESMTPVTKGDVWMLRGEQAGQWYIRASGTGTQMGGGPETRFDVIWGPSVNMWVDDEAKKVFERPVGTPTGKQAGIASAIRPHDTITSTTPFAKELAAAELVLEESKDVDGVKCDVVLVKMEGNQEMRWFFGQADGLPRQNERMFKGIQGAVVTTLRNLKPAELAPAAFTINTPEGFERDVVKGAAPAPAAAPVKPAESGGSSPAGPTPVVSEPTAATPAAAPARVTGASVGNTAPNFELQSMTGGTVALSSLRNSVVVLDFWGTWCIPCREYSPLMQKLHEDYSGKPVKVLGLAVRSKDEDVKAYFGEKKYSYGSLLRADQTAREFKVRTYPTFFVLGFEGEVLSVVTAGSKSAQENVAAIRTTIDDYLKSRGG